MVRFLGLLALWAVAFSGASQLIKRGVVDGGALGWGLAMLPIIAGVLVLFAFARWLREGDELQRTVQLVALAFGFGGTFFAIAAYRVFERLGAPAADLGDLALAMAILYTLGVFVGWWRYR